MPKTPTTRATWRHNGLVHHVLVQPDRVEDASTCHLLVACDGFRGDGFSMDLGHYDDMVTCVSCLGSNWEATVGKMDRDGLLSKVEDMHEDAVLHRIMMEGGAFADSALRPSPASRWR